jgi:hypothetical protein
LQLLALHLDILLKPLNSCLICRQGGAWLDGFDHLDHFCDAGKYRLLPSTFL